MPGRLLALLVVAATSLTACGGGDDGASGDRGPSEQEDKAEIERLMIAFGATSGGDVCDYQAPNLIAVDGSYADCRKVNEDASALVYKVESVAVSGDEATAVVTTKGSQPLHFELRRIDGEWKISDFPWDDDPATESESGPAAAEQEPAPAPTPEPSQEEDDETYVQTLFEAYATAKGSSLCALFSERFVNAELGGTLKCTRTFGRKKPGAVTLQKLSFTGPSKALAITKLNRDVVYFGLTQTGRRSNPWGGWEIDDLGFPGQG